MLHVRAAELEDADELAPKLRKADLQEIQAATGLPPQQVLQVGVEYSAPACTVIDSSGEVVGMFGVEPGAPQTGVVWLLGSDALGTRQFIRECRTWLRGLHATYPLLYNYIDKRNTLHIRWLRYMGFTFIAEHPQHGYEQRPFLEFVRLEHYV
jgi:hypothetical protein